jgi:hypothetical protein
LVVDFHGVDGSGWPNAITDLAQDAIMGTVFHKGVDHAHTPSHKWSDVQKHPNSPGAEFGVVYACQHFEPQSVVWLAKQWLSSDLAVSHIDWYLEGTGKDFNEDATLKSVLEKRSGVWSAIKRRLPKGMSKGKYTGHLKLEQADYGPDEDDARLSWGAIDRLDFEADFGAGALHVWFKDRYEWHPYYPKLYKPKTGDVARETNCVHAAFVEMKAYGAADFWMVGEATVFLIGSSSSTGGGGPSDL